jgi:hypothetical protein
LGAFGWMAKLAGEEKSAHSHPTLPPNAVVLQLTPRNDWRGLGKYGVDFHRHNRVGGQFGFDHPADQKVLLFGQGLHRRPLGQQQFFGIQRVHGLSQLRGGFSFPAPRPAPGQ